MKTLGLALLFCSALGGCSEATPKPFIDSLQMPPQATIGGDQLFDLDGTISFHDDAGQVTKIRIFIPAVAQTYEFPAPDGLSRASMALEVRFAPATPKGAIEYDVSLVDAAGVASASRRMMVTLE